MHVAAGAGTHVVAIYGSSSPERTPPLSTRATILRTGIACSPCFARECPLRHLRCLTEIAPATVLDAVLAGAAEPA
jgi:heptosyltransferase-2